MRSAPLALVLLAYGGRARAESAEPPAVECEEGGHLTVDPTDVTIHFFYSGSDLTVGADVPAGTRAAVVLEGEPSHVELREKGRVWGVLWMGVGDVEFDRVPSAYLVATSDPLADLAPARTLKRLGVGYDALASRAGGDASMFRELTKLKESEGLFAIDEGGVHLEPAEAGSAHLAASFPLSARVPIGTYTVRLLDFSDGGGRCLASTEVTVEQGGLVRTLRSLALDHGLLYGIVAVLIALLAGIGTGLIFGRGASQGH